MQKTFRSFIKKGKECKNVAFFWKERMPNPSMEVQSGHTQTWKFSQAAPSYDWNFSPDITLFWFVAGRAYFSTVDKSRAISKTFWKSLEPRAYRIRQILWQCLLQSWYFESTSGVGSSWWTPELRFVVKGPGYTTQLLIFTNKLSFKSMYCPVFASVSISREVLECQENFCHTVAEFL